MSLSHRRFTIVPLLLFIFFACAPASAAESPDPENLPSEYPGLSIGDLRRFADLIQRTGLGPDKIPALNKPEFASISDANLSMDNNEFVFVVNYKDDQVHIYPQRILVWHEVVNYAQPDIRSNVPYSSAGSPVSQAGESYTITYCPLTGSLTAFRSMAGKYPSTFGVSGNILNGNSVLYDRVSHSLWNQLIGVCLEGPFRGKRLERIPVLWARWGGVKERYAENGQVLTRATGFRRSYGKDPYGNYSTPGSYYDDARLPFPVRYLDPRLAPKERVLGLEADAAYGALLEDAVKEKKTLTFTLGVIPMVAIYDEQMDAVRIFDRRLPDWKTPLSFTFIDNKLVDEHTRSQWQLTGSCTSGRVREKQLTESIAINSMWFAWASFHRGTQIIPEQP
jgi:hypothetical protein